MARCDARPDLRPSPPRAQDVSLLSQFPAEKEILFAPLTGLEVASVPWVEGDVIMVELRLSCNLHDLTMEEVIGKMQKGHKSMVQNMLDELRHCAPPPEVLAPLQAVLADAARRGHEYFNVRAPPTLLWPSVAADAAPPACVFARPCLRLTAVRRCACTRAPRGRWRPSSAKRPTTC